MGAYHIRGDDDPARPPRRERLERGGRWQGHTDRPLTELGRRQARLLGRQLAATPVEAAYASDLRRAWETAELALAGRGIPVVRIRSLREVDVGSWAGLTARELEDRFPQELERWRDGGTGWSGGETYDDMAERVVAAVGEIAARHDGGSVLVVSHGGADCEPSRHARPGWATPTIAADIRSNRTPCCRPWPSRTGGSGR